MIINYIGASLLIIIGLALIIFKKNLIKIVIGMGVMDSGINLLLITIGFRTGGTAPIFISDLKEGAFFVDPIPQALTLTSIVIGACVTALALSLVIKIKERYGTIESDKVRRLKG
ncbi:MAG: NADH-quinone oxidoreductase subunit K [Clostridium sp.]|uniref:Na(+)/H(+) antiporter subunit C1 n=1 Tax=Clostridium paraputrificum TaxID=29363 RepID=A0A6N3GVL4_9CLOT|nr:sodium:proton antiporter [Clostridium sp.]MBS5925700.1 NADH-quinone oxidoreductase subunit K [Clostridium sp.]